MASMLDRYRKTGGFVQLLMLLETCGPQKQERFLELIRQESPAWADAIETKMLDVELIFRWSDETLGEVVGALQDLCLAVTIQSANEVLRAKLTKFLSSSRRRKIDELLERNAPSESEVQTMHMRVVEIVRRMVIDGTLRLDKINPKLVIEDGIEEKLNRGDQPKVEEPPAAPSLYKIEYEVDPNEVHETTHPSIVLEMNEPKTASTQPMELSTLRRKVADLQKENAVLRRDLAIARGKLDQIKKIA